MEEQHCFDYCDDGWLRVMSHPPTTRREDSSTDRRSFTISRGGDRLPEQGASAACHRLAPKLQHLQCGAAVDDYAPPEASHAE